MTYPYWGACEICRCENGWIVRRPMNSHSPITVISECYVFGDLQWDACQDFVKAVTTERSAGSATGDHL